MKQECPACGKPVETYHQFCPACEADLSVLHSDSPGPSNAHSLGLEGKSAAGKALKCPVCGKPIRDYHDMCPWCESDLPPRGVVRPHGDAEASGTNPQANAGGDGEKEPAESLSEFLHSWAQTVSCAKCGKEVPADYGFCTYCGAKLDPGAIQPAPPGRHSGPPAGDSALARALGTEEAVPASLQGENTALSEFSLPDSWADGMPLPLAIHSNQGRIYRKGVFNVIELQIANTANCPLVDLEVRVDSRLLKEPLVEEMVSPLQPGVSRPFSIPGFFPAHEGKDALKLSIKAKVRHRFEVHLTGSFHITVQDKRTDARDPVVNVTINSKELVYLEENAIPAFKEHPETPAVEYDRWEQVPLYWNQRTMERQLRCFPQACVQPGSCALDQDCLSDLLRIAPGNAPKAAVSFANGNVFHIVAGAALLLGYSRTDTNARTALVPEDAHGDSNGYISRMHCCVTVRENRVYIRDSSTHGSYLGKRRLPPNEEIPVAHEDVISLARKLELQVRTFTDGHNILCVSLTRLNNNVRERYILAPGPVPIGADAGLPIVVPGAPDLFGSVYFHPKSGTWRFRRDGTSLSSEADMVLCAFQELTAGAAKLCLAVMR